MTEDQKAAFLQQLINEQKARADEAMDDAKSALDTAIDFIEAIDYDDGVPLGADSTTPLDQLNAADTEIPEFEPLTPVEEKLTKSDLDSYFNSYAESPQLEELMNLAQEVSGIQEPSAPNIQDINIDTSNAPTSLGDFNGTAPTLENITFPSLPAALQNISGYDIPNMREFQVPNKPTVALPNFDEDINEVPISPLNFSSDEMQRLHEKFSPEVRAMICQEVDAYITKQNPQFYAQIDALNDKLKALSNGELGISKSQEDQFLERAKEKNMAEYKRTQQAAYAEAAKRGFTMPTGAVFSAVMMARQGLADNNARASNEMAIKQAELQQERIKFGVELLSRSIESMRNNALQYMGQQLSINGQVIDYAKSIIGSAIDIFNSQVNAQEIRLKLFQAKAQVYDVKLRAALSHIELYKQEIEALRAISSLDEIKFKAYQARIDILNTVANVYRTQIDAQAAKAQMSKIKMEVFEQEVKVYQTKMEAKKLEWDGYVKAITAKEAEANVNLARVRNYEAMVSAYSTKLNAKIAMLNAQVSKNKSLVDQFSSGVSAVRDIVGARATIAQTQLENQRQELQTQQAQISAASARAQMSLNEAVEKTKVLAENVRMMNARDLEVMRMNLQKSEAIARSSTSVSSLYSSAATAALGSIVNLVSLE